MITSGDFESVTTKGRGSVFISGYPTSFKVDENNRLILEKICLYLNNDKAFEIDGMSLKKGIMLMGGIGVGKTFTMKVICDVFIPKMDFVNCRRIASEFAIKGDEGIEKYIIADRTLTRWCFDDLGTEPDKNYYGSTVNVLLEVMLRRYDYGNYYKTFCTTNLNAGEIKKRYGDRLSDRFREMFNVITFPATDSRRV